MFGRVDRNVTRLLAVSTAFLFSSPHRPSNIFFEYLCEITGLTEQFLSLFILEMILQKFEIFLYKIKRSNY